MRPLYFDHNATTPVDDSVLSAMLPYFSERYGNPSSVHEFGQRARGAVEAAREQVAALIGARAAEVVFTSGGTEADNAAIFGLFGGFSGMLGDSCGHIVTTAVEHPAVLEACAALERRGIPVTYVGVGRSGIVDPGDIRAALRPDTRLVSLMHANNELGTIQPVAEVARIASLAGARFHCDAVQSAGKIATDVTEMGADLLSLSAHKFHGPKGVGALWIRKGLTLDPLLHGGHSERDRRAGTENVAGIVGMGEAARLAHGRIAHDAARITAMRDRLEQGLLQRIPGACVNGDPSRRVPNTTNLLLPAVDSEALVMALDLQGLACSAGAACASGTVNPSHVLTAIGLSAAEARASVRLSLGRDNTDEDVSRALELIPAAVSLQRKLAVGTKEMAALR